MRTYKEARDMVAQQGGKAWPVGNSGGRSRWARWRVEGDDVIVTLMGTDIVTFSPDHFTLNTNGYATPTTFDAMAAVLRTGRIAIGTRQKIPHYRGKPFADGDRHEYTTTHHQS